VIEGPIGGARRRVRVAHSVVDRRRVRQDQVYVVSDDCWGGELYKHLGLPFSTPFIGLLISPGHYVRLVPRLEHYLSAGLDFLDQPGTFRGSEYPVGVLGGDVEIHFLHYRTAVEAREKWMRRAERIDLDRVAIKFDASKPEASNADREAFLRLELPKKVAFAADRRPGCIHVPGWVEDGTEMFARTQRVFDAVGWIVGSNGALSGPARALRRVVYS
jgi:uncharacterized protein (DUF1919 family)